MTAWQCSSDLMKNCQFWFDSFIYWFISPFFVFFIGFGYKSSKCSGFYQYLLDFISLGDILSLSSFRPYLKLRCYFRSDSISLSWNQSFFVENLRVKLESISFGWILRVLAEFLYVRLIFLRFCQFGLNPIRLSLTSTFTFWFYYFCFRFLQFWSNSLSLREILQFSLDSMILCWNLTVWMKNC